MSRSLSLVEVAPSFQKRSLSKVLFLTGQSTRVSFKIHLTQTRWRDYWRNSLCFFTSKESQLWKLGISGSSVHTFTKISVGSQTDLEALLAYVKSLQAKLEESVDEKAHEDPETSNLSIESHTQTLETERIAESSQVTPSLSDMLAVVDSGNSTPTNSHRQVRERDRDRPLSSPLLTNNNSHH